ncbi:MAG: SPFH domain-containing protein [Planctomycetota bacterium]|jgi:regulator of protease activity HflC (stomatin/prohibitin superfamily)|nr:SPFH domain-containing protein [Planctomycetota bacterium]MDP6763728.1 SPFH domain-containing protein [Planctomycetota bacterium]MDP6989246.1 SPFH domain-containing protein [Planctomycetota bacterium]
MLLELLQAVTGVFVVIYDGQHGLKFTLGRAGPIYGPGVHFKAPIIQSFRVEETKHTTLDLEPQVIQLSDDLVYEVDCKVVYRISDLRKAMIEIDDLVTGLQNRVVMAVQKVVQAKDRVSILDTETLCEEIHAELGGVEEQWGVTILQLGFSNISPSPATLEITQLELLAREKLALFEHFRASGVDTEAAVALIAGAVVSLEAEPGSEGLREDGAAEAARVEALDAAIEEIEKERKAAERETSEEAAPEEAEDDEGEEE